MQGQFNTKHRRDACAKRVEQITPSLELTKIQIQLIGTVVKNAKENPESCPNTRIAINSNSIRQEQ